MASRHGRSIAAWVRLSHGWRLDSTTSASRDTIADFIRPAVRAIPRGIARRLKPCRIGLPDTIEGGRVASRWMESDDSIEIEVAAGAGDPHDLALELLMCIGQALWERITATEEAAWLSILEFEIGSEVPGEIDEDALREKHRLLSGPTAARSMRRLRDYARASFASTAAEYVHCLWHDVTVRMGAGHLPPDSLRRRLELMARWFPPDRGYRLFPR